MGPTCAGQTFRIRGRSCVRYSSATLLLRRTAPPHPYSAFWGPVPLTRSFGRKCPRGAKWPRLPPLQAVRLAKRSFWQGFPQKFCDLTLAADFCTHRPTSHWVSTWPPSRSFNLSIPQTVEVIEPNDYVASSWRFMPAQLSRVEASGVPAPRQCVSRLTAR